MKTEEDLSWPWFQWFRSNNFEFFQIIFQCSRSHQLGNKNNCLFIFIIDWSWFPTVIKSNNIRMLKFFQNVRFKLKKVLRNCCICSIIHFITLLIQYNVIFKYVTVSILLRNWIQYYITSPYPFYYVNK